MWPTAPHTWAVWSTDAELTSVPGWAEAPHTRGTGNILDPDLVVVGHVGVYKIKIYQVYTLCML